VGTNIAGRCDFGRCIAAIESFVYLGFLFGDIIGSIDKRLKVHVQGKI